MAETQVLEGQPCTTSTATLSYQSSQIFGCQVRSQLDWIKGKHHDKHHLGYSPIQKSTQYPYPKHTRPQQQQEAPSPRQKCNKSNHACIKGYHRWSIAGLGSTCNSQNTTEDLLSTLQLLDAIIQEASLTLWGCRLGSDGFDFCVGETVDHDWREDLLEATDDVAFDDLGGDVCDESLLGYLEWGVRLVWWSRVEKGCREIGRDREQLIWK